LYALALGMLTGARAATAAPPPAAVLADRQTLFLSVSVNRSPRPGVHEVLRRDGAFYVKPETLREWGLRPPADARDGEDVPLDRLPGVTLHYVVELQQLELTVPVAMLDGVPLRLTSGIAAGQAPDTAKRVPGLLVNYDLFVQKGRDVASINALTEMRVLSLFGGVLSHGLSAHSVHAPAAADQGVTRLDTTWRRSMYEDMYTVTAGDLVARGLQWTRPLRLGGLQVARDFSLQPYRPTSPLMTVTADAALPSTVELFINGQRQLGQQVAPGTFRIDTLPSVTGAGSAQVVVTDLAGRAQRIDLDFYAAPALLQQGLLDGSFEAGYPRRGFGLASADYASRPVALGTLRYGLADAFTLEAHGETSRDVWMAGIGGIVRVPGRWGLFGGALARSDSAGASGTLQSWAYQYLEPRYSVTGTLLRRSRGFRDAAAVVDGAPPRLLASVAFGISTPLGRWSIGGARQVAFDGTRSSLVTASLTRDLPGHSMLTLSLLAGTGPHARSPQLAVNWSMPLDPGGTLAATYSHADGRHAAAVQYSHEPRPETGGIGYRLEASGDGAGSGAHLQLHEATAVAQWTAGVFQRESIAPLAYAGIDGSLLFAGGGLHPMGSAGESFAVVSTSGLASIPVRLENRLVGTTDATGTLFVPQLNAYQANHLSIDTLDLPVEFHPAGVEASAVPERGGGVAVAFDIRRMHPLQLTVRDATGRYLPVGSEAAIANAQGEQAHTVVGHEGFVYVESPPDEPSVLTVRGESGTCTARLPAPSPAGNVSCIPGDAPR